MTVRNQWARSAARAVVESVSVSLAGSYALLALGCAPESASEQTDAQDAALDRVACGTHDTGLGMDAALNADTSVQGDGAGMLDAMASTDSSLADASQPLPPDRPITVALTFDDTNIDQLLAVPALARHGFHATFFVNSPRIGTAGYFTLANAQQLEADGHEIGGHTLTHGDLSALSEADQRKEICDDRNALVAHGFDVRSFAYPRGLQTTLTRGVVESCGYDSARLVSGAACSACQPAESIPPADFYGVRAPGSVRNTDTVAGLIAMIERARSVGGGLVALTFHRICDTRGVAGTPPQCAQTYGINLSDFEALLAWIAAQADVQVRTMAQVIDRAPPRVLENLQANPSFESWGSSMPSCFTSFVSGTLTPEITSSSTAVEGSRSLQLSVSGFVSGGALRVYTDHTSACEAPAAPGECYRLRATYQWTPALPADSGADLRIFLQRKAASSGSWDTYNTSQGLSAATNGWGVVTYDAPCLPADTSAVALGIQVRGNGVARIDSLRLEKL
jgi:peptidoglycan/xylan/chitin deacetylase (PgdA/CDA1 family)